MENKFGVWKFDQVRTSWFEFFDPFFVPLHHSSFPFPKTWCFYRHEPWKTRNPEKPGLKSNFIRANQVFSGLWHQGPENPVPVQIRGPIFTLCHNDYSWIRPISNMFINLWKIIKRRPNLWFRTSLALASGESDSWQFRVRATTNCDFKYIISHFVRN